MVANYDVRDTEAANKYIQQAGVSLESGDRESAIEALEAAYTADPDNAEVCFRLAYELDMVGEEDEAMHLYEQAVHTPTPPLNALINLAILYEDRGDYAKAERCLRQVLGTDPNHPRAKLYIKDVCASTRMVIDDEEDKRQAKHHALLDTPVTDFDLSVRARNALRKMNVRTLGDLLRVTEAELRSFKNFGEASLEEIKTMLAQRGLRLGQAVDQQHTAAKEKIYEQLGEDGDADELNKTVNELELSVRARKALSLLNIHTIGDLCAHTEAELMGVKNFGMTSLLEIKEKLNERGMSLRKLDE
jgi:DNA-directed RNA polymerase subunit alpha